ncbi:MAG TPA: hypothetical protein VFB36_12470 [Nevskiaceae bacterium]|nr:hypothetical protein [Nevskiaceae bacterium]
MRVDVLNPDGRDAPVDYRNGVGAPDARTHPPVNYWAYAAATGGQFHQSVDAVRDPCDAVIVLLRRRNGPAIRAIERLKRAGRRVFVSWKETGLHQIDQQTRWWWQRSSFHRALSIADGAVAATEASIERYRRDAPSQFPVHFIPTPYPVDVAGWDFSVSSGQRRGILVGTREFDVPSRRHEAALALAAEIASRTKVPVTVMCGAPRDRDRVRKLLAGVELTLVEQRLPYPDYLKMVARHRLVLQLDRSHVPGQVAGDALLCRTLCIGGNGTSEQIAFPEYAAMNDHAHEIEDAARVLLDDADAYRAAIERSQRLAMDGLSFTWARRSLRSLSTATA